MPYSKTVWDENTAITPARLNNLETQYEKAMEDAVTEAKQMVQYYVATTGNDNNSGASGSPFKTIQRAVNEAYKTIAGRVRINIAAGTYTENIEIENMMCPEVFFYGADKTTTIISGDIDISNAQCIRLYRLTIRDQNYGVVSANGLKKLKMDDVIIDNVTIAGVYIKATEMVEINNSSIDAGGKAIDCSTVGTLCAVSVEISSVQTHGIEISRGTFAYTWGLTGNIGTVPVHSVSGSILIKGTSSITGGADDTSIGGQIFE